MPIALAIRQRKAQSFEIMHLQQTKVASGATNSGQTCDFVVVPFIEDDVIKSKHERAEQKHRFVANSIRAERVVSAAVRLSSGAVFSGILHADANEKAQAAYANKSESYFRRLFAHVEDGFETSKGRFITPVEAYKLAVKRRQITKRAYSKSVKNLWGIDQKECFLNAIAFSDNRAS